MFAVGYHFHKTVCKHCHAKCANILTIHLAHCIAPMCETFCAGIQGLFYNVRSCICVTNGANNAHVTNFGNKRYAVRKFRRNCHNFDKSIGHLLVLHKLVHRWFLQVFNRHCTTLFRRQKWSFQVDALHFGKVLGKFQNELDLAEDNFVAVRHDGGQNCAYAMGNVKLHYLFHSVKICCVKVVAICAMGVDIHQRWQQKSALAVDNFRLVVWHDVGCNFDNSSVVGKNIRFDKSLAN